MDKRFIVGMLVSISLALVGLIVIQVVWIHETMELRQEQFSRAVDNALFDVSDVLERTERMGELRRHRTGRRLLVKLDSLRLMEASSMHEDTRLKEEATPLEKPMGIHEGDEVISPSPPAELPSQGSAAGNQPLKHYEEPEHYEEMVTDLVRGILSGQARRAIGQRVDAMLVDSLLITRLAPLGVDGAIPWGVFSGEGVWEDLPGAAKVDTSLLRSSVHRERLFRHDPGGHAHFLHVFVNQTRASRLSGLWPMFVASVLFVIVIALAFVHTIRTIVRQKRISDIRNDLVNNLTHELKTPISTIGLACEALSDPSIPRSEEQVRSYTNMIRDENKRLGALVENVLLSAVQDSGHMVLKPVDLDLHAVIDDVVRSSHLLVSRRNGKVELDTKAEIHHLRGDRIHLTNLLYNLIDNAVKYSETEPRIRITSRNDDQGITLSIADNGIGISRSEQRKIFDRLYRVPTGDLHNAKGFGLGLSYVKNVVDGHGGRITVESTPGQGSTFHIFFPFEHDHTHQGPRRGGR